jgi:hypothetical protein
MQNMHVFVEYVKYVAYHHVTYYAYYAYFAYKSIRHTEYPGDMHISSWPFVPKKLRGTNRQDMVYIRPHGISVGAFQLRMGNIWFCKLLRLFKISTKTDTGMQQHECAYVAVLEEYNRPRKAGHIGHIIYIMYILHILMG